MLNAVEVEHLTVRYPGIRAVDDVSFSVGEGDFLGIIGPNGAGKSPPGFSDQFPPRRI